MRGIRRSKIIKEEKNTAADDPAPDSGMGCGEGDGAAPSGEKRVYSSGEPGKRRRLLSDILLLLCAVLLLYPVFSDFASSVCGTKLYGMYMESAGDLGNAEYEEMLEAARAYNEWLAGRGDDRFSLTEEEEKEYFSLLALPGTDAMAYLSIEKLGIEFLPVYHSTEQSVLQSGAGHLMGSSLPVGGESTHAVLSAHSGMAGNRLFTDLRRLEIGDTFTIHVLGEELTYKVDQIEMVDPDDLSLLEIEEGEDFCTLITCTPPGLNTHRLLVRGSRIETPEEAEESASEASFLEWLADFLKSVPAWEWIMTAAGALILGIFLIPDLVKAVRNRKRTGIKKTG